MILNPALRLSTFSVACIVRVQILELYPVFTDFMLDTKEIFKKQQQQNENASFLPSKTLIRNRIYMESFVFFFGKFNISKRTSVVQGSVPERI